jgi:hypothetical protein
MSPAAAPSSCAASSGSPCVPEPHWGNRPERLAVEGPTPRWHSDYTMANVATAIGGARSTPRARLKASRAAFTELGVTVALLALYFLLRGSHPDDIPASVARMQQVVDLEQRLGIFHEEGMQDFFARWPAVIDVANVVYVWGLFPVLIVIGIWLALFHLDEFRFIRTVLLISAVFGLLGYWLFPAAPPRFLAAHGFDYGFIDTVHGSNKDMQPKWFLNEYAALPSFHFAWVALGASAVWRATPNAWARAIATLIAIAVGWAVVVTANHLFFDMIVGALLIALSWVLALWVTPMTTPAWWRGHRIHVHRPHPHPLRLRHDR